MKKNTKPVTTSLSRALDSEDFRNNVLELLTLCPETQTSELRRYLESRGFDSIAGKALLREILDAR